MSMSYQTIKNKVKPSSVIYVAPGGLRTVRPDAVFITAGEETTLCPLDISEKIGPEVIDGTDDESSQALAM